MKQENITAAVNKYWYYVPDPNTVGAYLKNASDDCVEELMHLKLKNKYLAIALSFFFGWLGVGRFYLGDVKVGIWRVALYLLLIPINLFAFVEADIVFLVIVSVLNLAYALWVFFDHFAVYQDAMSMNEQILIGFVSRHRAGQVHVPIGKQLRTARVVPPAKGKVLGIYTCRCCGQRVGIYTYEQQYVCPGCFAVFGCDEVIELLEKERATAAEFKAPYT